LILFHRLKRLLGGLERESGDDVHASESLVRNRVRFARMSNRVAVFVNEVLSIRSGAESPNVERFPFKGLDQQRVSFFIVALREGNARKISVRSWKIGIQVDGFGE